MTDPVISELLRQCESLQDVVTRIDALAGMRLRSAIPAVLAMLGVRVA